MSRSKKAKPRDYVMEYKRDHASKKAKLDRAARNHARANTPGVKKGDGQEVDHIVPLSKGGSRTAKSNRRVVSRTTNRRKGSKT